MKKQTRYYSILIISFILLIVCLSGFAGAESVGKVFDQAGLLTSEEISELNIALEEFRNKHGLDIAFGTTMSNDGKGIEAYTDDFYEEVSMDYDGLLFMLDMTERDIHISTHGSAIDKFSDAALDGIIANIAPYLTGGDYFQAAKLFVEESERTLEYESSGIMNSSDSAGIADEEYLEGEMLYTKEPFFQFKYLFFALLAAGLICGVMYFSHKKSMRSQPSVLSYQDAQGLVLTVNQDRFLRTHTSKTRKPQNNGGSSGGGSSNRSGGSSTHRSSSGSTFGGRSGKF